MDKEKLLKLVQDAYEEGVEDGIEWASSKSSEPWPGWIDSVARVEALRSHAPK